MDEVYGGKRTIGGDMRGHGGSRGRRGCYMGKGTGKADKTFSESGMDPT